MNVRCTACVGMHMGGGCIVLLVVALEQQVGSPGSQMCPTQGLEHCARKSAHAVHTNCACLVPPGARLPAPCPTAARVAPTFRPASLQTSQALESTVLLQHVMMMRCLLLTYARLPNAAPTHLSPPSQTIESINLLKMRKTPFIIGECLFVQFGS